MGRRRSTPVLHRDADGHLRGVTVTTRGARVLVRVEETDDGEVSTAVDLGPEQAVALAARLLVAAERVVARCTDLDESDGT